MPGIFVGETYDAVGAAVGAVDTAAHRILPDLEGMLTGDVILG
jgi:phosphoribosylamine--glycine ligase/phosphoribosylformylglycinamidine cyclo-ligase